MLILELKIILNIDFCRLTFTLCSKDIEKCCTDIRFATGKLGSILVKALNKRLLQLKAASNLQVIFDNHLGSPEILQGNKITIIVSLTMTANVRLLLDLKRPPDENIKSKLKEITEVTIREIKDYHGTGKTYVS